MPLYSYVCAECGKSETAFRHIDERNIPPDHACGPMERVITAPMVRPDIQPYQSPIDGRTISSRKQRMEDLKRNRARPWEGMEAERKHAESVRASQEAKAEGKLKERIADVMNNMDSAKQKVLKEGKVTPM